MIMATNMTEWRGENMRPDDALGRPNRDLRPVDVPAQPQRPQQIHVPDGGDGRPYGGTATAGAAQDLVLGPLVDQVAYGFARVLVVATKELESHIANENRKLGDAVGERLGALQASLDELASALSDQRSANRAVKEKCDALESETALLKESDKHRQEEITALRADSTAAVTSISERIDSVTVSLQQAHDKQQEEIASVCGRLDTETAALRECDARLESEITALRTETHGAVAAASQRIQTLHNDLAVQQEDIAAMKAAVSGFSSRVDSVLERLDRQAEAVHSMYTTYAKRESELEQVIEGLTRLRSVPAPAPAPRL